MGEMESVITLSSDESDVEIVGSYEVITKTEPLPLSSVRVDVDAVSVNIPTHYIDLSDPRWVLPELKLHKRQSATIPAVIDLTESDVHEMEQKTENSPHDCQLIKASTNMNKICKTQDFNLQQSSSRDSSVVAPQQDWGNLKPKQRRLNSLTQHRKQSHKAHPYHQTPAVKLTRLPFLETHVTELKTSKCSVSLTKDSAQMSLCFRQMNSNSEASECSHLGTTAASNVVHTQHLFQVVRSQIGQGQQESSDEFASAQLEDKPSLHLQRAAESPCSENGSSVATSEDHSTCEDERDDLCSSMHIPSPPVTSSSQDEAQGEVLCSTLEHLEDRAESRQRRLSDHSSLHSVSTRLSSSERSDPDSRSNRSPIPHNITSQGKPSPTSELLSAENMPHWQLETGTYKGDVEMESPLSFLWQEGSNGDDMNEESRFGTDFRTVTREERHSVCPVALRKIMAPIDEDDEDCGKPELLCRRSLSLVYSTIDENYTEGTLQLLSDLLQPGYYPPRDITSHLLRNILLDPQCPPHLCVQAFNLLMRTQRHHIADKTTVPWDWELLTSVMTNQDHTKTHRCEVVRMLLEYTVQTLEDDFQAKCFTSALHHSITKATLSCDQQFPQVRDVIKWLFGAIMKSTDHGGTTREREEQIKMVSIFQRMLSLALDVDRSPALTSAKLSQELFHMLIGNVPLRAHRTLLLESLQSKLLRCKLLEHLLDYACPQKMSLPMSLSLLLHFLKYCTLAPDPMDGTERWQKWEELIHLLWMLLLSYNKAMKGYLCSSFTKQRGRAGTLVYKQDDMVSKPAVLEAVAAFLSRSQADLGQALPRHVEESLTYLQDHLLAVSKSWEHVDVGICQGCSADGGGVGSGSSPTSS